MFVDGFKDLAVPQVAARAAGFGQNPLRNKQVRRVLGVGGVLSERLVDRRDPLVGLAPDEKIEAVVQNAIVVGLRLENGVAVGGGHGAAQHPGGVGAAGGAVQQADERGPLDIHGAGEDGIGVGDAPLHFAGRGRLGIEVDELEFPVLGHLRRKRQQAQGWEGRLPAYVLHDIPVAPERIRGELR